MKKRLIITYKKTNSLLEFGKEFQGLMTKNNKNFINDVLFNG